MTKWFMLFLILIMISLSLPARNISNGQIGLSEKSVDLKELCLFMGHKELLLVTPASLSEIDCMGKKVRVTDFCLAKFPARMGFLRGIVDSDNNKAVCQYGTEVNLKVPCDDIDGHYCRKGKKGCEELGVLFAHDLELFHHFFTRDESSGAKDLNCYFSKKDPSDLMEGPVP